MTTKVSHKHQKSNFEWSTYLLFDVVLLERLDELCGEVRPRVRLVEPSAESRSARIHMNSANGTRGHAVQMDMSVRGVVRVERRQLLLQGASTHLTKSRVTF